MDKYADENGRERVVERVVDMEESVECEWNGEFVEHVSEKEREFDCPGHNVSRSISGCFVYVVKLIGLPVSTGSMVSRHFEKNRVNNEMSLEQSFFSNPL